MEESTARMEMYQPSVVYDFYNGAPGASWKTTGKIIIFGGTLSDDGGSAKYLNNTRLENGVIYLRVLETIPSWGDYAGTVNGIFPNPSDDINIPAGARFTAKVGFTDASTTPGAGFRIRFDDGSRLYFFPDSNGFESLNDGTLDTLNFDLSSIAGKSGKVYLEVASTNGIQCNAVWVDPKIVK